MRTRVDIIIPCGYITRVYVSPPAQRAILPPERIYIICTCAPASKVFWARFDLISRIAPCFDRLVRACIAQCHMLVLRDSETFALYFTISCL